MVIFASVLILVKRIMVTGVGGPAAINFVRSLRISKERFVITGTEINKYYLQLADVDKKFLVPKCDSPKYIDELNVIIKTEKIEFVHPQPDVEVSVVSENREKIEASTFLPSKEAIRICQDKFKSAEVWRKKGFPEIKTVELRKESDIAKAFDELGTPIWIRAKRGVGGRGSTPASNIETASSWLRYWKARNKDWEFIAQQYMPGRNIGFHSLWKEGELITSMARERVEYVYPYLAPSGITGTPSVQRTIHSDEVNEIASDSVLAVDSSFNGIACVDLKESEGGPYPTEINAGRMFTTSFFFSYASKKLLGNFYANIPYLYVKLAYEETLPDMPKYNTLPEGLYWIRHIDAPAKLVTFK